MNGNDGDAIERLFIDKLEEKYQLNARSLKKAFRDYDTNGNGLLELDEVGGVVKAVLNGVTPQQVQGLLARFDVNGDGQVTYEEFLAYLLQRKDDLERGIGKRSGSSSGNGNGAAAARKENRPSSALLNRPAGKASGQKGNGIGPYSDEPEPPRRPVAAAARGGRRPQYRDTNGGNYHDDEEDEEDAYGDAQEEEDDDEDYEDTQQYRRRNGPPLALGSQRNPRGMQGRQRQQAWEAESDAASERSGRSDAPSTFDPTDPRALRARCKAYLEALRTALRMRHDGTLPQRESVTMQTTDVIHSVARSLLAKAFQPYTGVDSGRARGPTVARVEEGDFIRVLRGFQFPGMPPTRGEVLRYVFQLCRDMDAEPAAVPRATNRAVGSSGGGQSSWDGYGGNGDAAQAADPAHLMELVFGEGARAASTRFVPRPRKDAVDVAAERAAATNELSKSFVERSNQHRREIGRGPLPGDNLGGYEMNRSGGGGGNGGNGGNGGGEDDAPSGARAKVAAIDAVPLRFLSRKTCTSLVPPSDFDVAALKRSAQLPAVEATRDFVFGLSQRAIGPAIRAIPSAPANANTHANAAAPGGGYPGSAPPRSAGGGRSAQANTHVSLVYASAAMGVVHDVRTNRQRLYVGHDDDVSCLALSNDGSLAATGVMGKWPVVHVWRTGADPQDQYTSGAARRARTGEDEAEGVRRQGECAFVVAVGEKFFARLVCAISFCCDDRYLAAVGCDDHHSIGVWALPSGTMVAQSVCQNGLPPQIKDLQWSPGQQFAQFISRDQSGPCDLMCTAGERHIRVWSFRRPSPAVPGGKGQPPAPPVEASLAFRALSMGKGSASPAKVYTCCAFSPCADKTFDVVAGGSNGVVYLWRAGELCATQAAIKGGVLAMVVQGDRVFCGGARGVVKALDARTLGPIATFSAVPTAGIGAVPRSAGLGPGNTPRGAADDGALSARAMNDMSGDGADLFAPRQGSSSAGARPKSAGASAAGRMARPASAGRLRPPSAAPGGSRGGTGAASSAATGSDGAAAAGSNDVVGLVVVRGMGRSSASQSLSLVQSTYIIAATAAGRAVRIDVGTFLNPAGAAPTPGAAGRPGSAGAGAPVSASSHRRPTPADVSAAPVTALLHYHTGSVWGLTTERRAETGGTLVGTVGDDRWLCVWDAADRTLLGRAALGAGARACHFDKYSNFIAVGAVNGTVSVHALSFTSALAVTLKEVAFRKDGRDAITDVKFSPSNTRLAAGSHDDTIVVYACTLTAAAAADTGRRGAPSAASACALKPLHRLRGHSSVVRHLDWSADSSLLRSTCSAHELLFWDVEAGRQFVDPTAADVRWKTHTCTLGFAVMGIWPKYADGTQINAVDACTELGVVATADADGNLNLLNFPSVVKEAPRRAYTGHSSYVENVRFLPAPLAPGHGSRPGALDAVSRLDRQMVATVGGDDCALILWSLWPAPSDRDRRERGRVNDYTTAL